MAETDNYPLGRNIFHSVRLDAQHLLWRLHTGYILHPRIHVTDNMKIAKLGTGTGVWLFEGAKYLPTTAQLDGFDISDEQFPLKEQCPPNLRFGIMDSFVDPPASLVGQYDVGAVEARRVYSMGRGIPDPPGGCGEKAKQFEAGMNALFDRVGLNYSWVPNLSKRVKQLCFLLIEFERQQF
ncbi:hypothetical protein AFLA_006188 [Aspergillus flavus NRRL3357]|nr:hypothetical protein AFLA_006188 [Aspergillus flavus NRRL3357]